MTPIDILLTLFLAPLVITSGVIVSMAMITVLVLIYDGIERRRKLRRKKK